MVLGGLCLGFSVQGLGFRVFVFLEFRAFGPGRGVCSVRRANRLGFGGSPPAIIDLSFRSCGRCYNCRGLKSSIYLYFWVSIIQKQPYIYIYIYIHVSAIWVLRPVWKGRLDLGHPT